MGSTGYSTGPHAHFEIRIDGQYVNPVEYLQGVEVGTQNENETTIELNAKEENKK